MTQSEIIPLIVAAVSLFSVAGLFAPCIRHVPHGKVGVLCRKLPGRKIKVIHVYSSGWHFIFPFPGSYFETIQERRRTGVIVLATPRMYQPSYRAELDAVYVFQPTGLLGLIMVNSVQLDIDLMASDALRAAFTYQMDLRPQLGELQGAPGLLGNIGEFASARLKRYDFRFEKPHVHVSTDALMQNVEVFEEA